MATIEFQGKNFDIDEDGFIGNYEDGKCDEWVAYVKEQEGIETLTEEHTKVIKVLQEYYEQNQIAPMVRVLSKLTGCKLKHLYEL